MRNRRRVKKIIFTVVATVFGVVAVLVAALFAAAFYLNHTSEPPPTYYLHSTEPYQAVHVPFTLRNGKIYLPMVISGWKMEGLLDTGGFNITWNQDLHLRGRTTGRTVSSTDAGNNKINHAKQVVIHSVNFGNYEVRGLVTYAIDTKATPKSMIAHTVSQTPLVGNEAFCGCVLTIDYYQKEIIVRDPSYDFTKEHHAPNAILLPFQRGMRKVKNFYGKPIVPAEINGTPAQMQIDTGWSGRVGLNEAFAARTLPNTKRVPSTDSHGNLSYFYPPVRVAFEPTTNPTSQNGVPKNGSPTKKPVWMLSAKVYPNVKQRWDASVGYGLLRFFRVTIDYPRQKILLEPYGEDKVQILPKGTLYTVQQAVQQETQKGQQRNEDVQESGVRRVGAGENGFHW